MNKRANEITLNDEQFEQLKERYVDTIVDNMTLEELHAYVYDNLNDFCDKLTEKQLIEEIEYTLSEEDLQEFITDIKNDSEDKM